MWGEESGGRGRKNARRRINQSDGVDKKQRGYEARGSRGILERMGGRKRGDREVEAGAKTRGQEADISHCISSMSTSSPQRQIKTQRHQGGRGQPDF